MTALREALVRAVRDADCCGRFDGAMHRERLSCPECMANIASAVLAAADAGESEGPWTFEYDGNDGEAGWWVVGLDTGDSLYCVTLRTVEEARAVCNALNRIALTGAGRGDNA